MNTSRQFYANVKGAALQLAMHVHYVHAIRDALEAKEIHYARAMARHARQFWKAYLHYTAP